MDETKNLTAIQTIQDLYQFLAQRYILEKTGLERIDIRMSEYEIPFLPLPEEKQDTYQKKDFMGLRYIYMRNDVHMERLTADQAALLEKALNNPEEEKAIKPAMNLVRDTFRHILAFSDTPDINVELFPSISGEGNVPGDAIVFVIASEQDYDGCGNIRDWEKETRKKNVLYSLKKQLEPICEKILQIPVRVLII